MANIFCSPEFWKLALPLIGAIIAWFINEWRKRLADQYERKETNYKEIVRSLRGFYVGAANAEELKLEFLNQLSISWLYCPDDVIRKGYAFMDTVHSRQQRSDTEKELAFGEFMLAIRKDLLSRTLFRSTSLGSQDFRHFVVTKIEA